MTLNEIVENKQTELYNIIGPCSGIEALSKHVLASEINAEIKGLVFCHPDLNSKTGITISKGSLKEFALHRKIKLEEQLRELEEAKQIISNGGNT